MDKKFTTTTVKMDDKLYQDFRIMGVRTALNFQDFVNRAMFLYMTDGDYRYKIHQTYNTFYTGSELLNAIGK